MSLLTRRNFLKLAASAALALPWSDVSPAFAALYEPEEPDPIDPPASLGRVTTWGIDIRESPERQGKFVRILKRDEVLPLHEQVGGEPLMPHNWVWYKTDEGYVYSSWVQPVEDIKNEPKPYKAVSKFWGEVTVPFTGARMTPDPQAGLYMRLYYTSVFRVIDAVVGKDDQWWYRLQEGITYNPGPYVPAAHIRFIDPADLMPISPGVKDKHVEVDLKAQTITAYESGKAVMTSRVASGFGEFRTPRGKHSVLYKYPTARMIGGTGSNYYDLPGVAFPTFITWSGVAIHGTYWHNDYGRPRSHGCLNVPAPVARWFWRWTAPSAPYYEAMYYAPKDAPATTVIVA